jgi:GNAT superfamily N-acetyltransferase
MSGDGELRILVNPVAIEAEVGPAFLTRCFARPWTDVMYRWYLRRSFGGEVSDRLILMDGAHAVAGCGVVYRQLRTQDGEVHRVSVVVAACTLPSARGRGCYARVLQAAADRSAVRGCAALLGFVTADNATGRGLRRLGAAAIPSAYIVSRQRAPFPEAGILQLRDAKVADDWPARAEARLRAEAAPAAFHYPDASAWRSQMVDRPHCVQTLRIGATCRAVVEGVGDTDRLQWLDGDVRERLAAIRAIVARARCRRRKFFMYSTCPHEAAAARRLGLAAHPGYMMALALQAGHASTVRDWASISWRVQSGDRL